MNSPDAINAYELCSRVLDQAQGDVMPLLELARAQETDWLEFKACCEPPPEGVDHGANAHDYRWHVARAIVALANTHGGCLLLGVDDHGKPVGLGSSDPFGRIEKESMDAFLRHLDDSVVRPKAGWKCSKQGILKLDDPFPENLIEYRQASLDGIPLVAVLVRPAADGASCLYCTEIVGGKHRHFLLIRQAGHVGQVREISLPKEIIRWEKERKAANEHLAELWKRFQSRKPQEKSTRRMWLVAGTTITVMLLGGLGIYSLLKPEKHDVIPKPKPFATIQLRELEITFAGKKENLTPSALEGMATVLYETSPASDGNSLWVNWKQQAEGVMERVLYVAGSSLVANVVGSVSPPLAEPEGTRWYSWAASLWPSPTARAENQAKAQSKFVPTQLSLTVAGVEIRVQGAFASIKGMPKKVVLDEISKKLREQGISVP
jgi:hypothetical protein